MARLVLVGLPGVGKTTIAAALAHRWGVTAIDCDDAFEQTFGETVQTVLRRDGEAVFREREVEVLEHVLTHDAVIATGGGVVTTLRARGVLRDAVTVWLDAPDAAIVQRLAQGDRPLIGDDVAQSVAHLRSRRAGLYADVSCAHIMTDRALERCCDDIEDVINERVL
jgi:shikimate kinase